MSFEKTKHTRDGCLVLFFIGLLTILLGWYLYIALAQGGFVKRSVDTELWSIMGAKPRGFCVPTPDRLLSGFFQQRVEDVASDQFPWRRHFIRFFFDARRFYYQTILRILPGEWSPVMPVGGRIGRLKNDARLCPLPKLYSVQNEARMSARAGYYNRLAANHTNVAIFVCAVVPVGDWAAVSASGFGSSVPILAGDRYVTAFRRMIDPGIQYTWIGEGRAPDAIMKLHYKTDHHFTMRGAYQMYLQIHAMLLARNENIGPALVPARWFMVPGVRFYGSSARLAGGYEGIDDIFEDAEFALPTCRVTSSAPASMRRERTCRGEYKTNAIPQGKFDNHYARYFGWDYGLVEYACDIQSDRALLVINDSFHTSIEPLLAAHYRHSYFVDPRSYKCEVGEVLDIDDLIRKYRIDDVLFLGNQTWVLSLDY